MFVRLWYVGKYVALMLRVQNMNYNLHFKGRRDQARSKTHVLLEQDVKKYFKIMSVFYSYKLYIKFDIRFSISWEVGLT